jgi:uncharacterized membrane protein
MRRALSKFLAVPLLVVLAIIVGAATTWLLERSGIGWIQRLRSSLSEVLFTSADATAGFLGTAGSGMVTLTSITISMLLLVLQQTASNMGNMVYDQFLTRRRNQVYAGFIVGGAVVPLFLRALVSDDTNPVLAATFVLAVLVLSLVGLLWFLYMTIDQMRPSTVVSDIYEKTRKARQQHLRLIRRTRRESESDAPVQAVLLARKPGYVTEIDFEAIRDCLEDVPADVEVIGEAAIGGYVSYAEPMAEIKASDREVGRRVAERLSRAYYVERRRQLKGDPGFGLRQLEMIAWAEVSTAKQNPETGMMVTRALRDLISRWVLGVDEVEVEGEPLPVVIEDNVHRDALDVLESVAVASSESMQHQNFAEVLNGLTVIYPWLPVGLQARADDLLARALSAMGDHVLTRDVELAIEGLSHVIEETGGKETTRMLRDACQELGASVGQLASRATRVKAGG